MSAPAPEMTLVASVNPVQLCDFSKKVPFSPMALGEECMSRRGSGGMSPQ